MYDPAGMFEISGSKIRKPWLPVGSWWLYDIANTIFSMGIESLFFALWIREQVGAEKADKVFGVLTSISFGIIFLLAPILGALSDRARRRMPFLVVSTGICVLATGIMGHLPFVWALILFVVALASYNAGLQFYDSLLASVSTPENRGRIGGIGVGLGYLGALIAISYGLAFKELDKPTLFTVIAGTFLLFSLPCFLFVEEKENLRPKKFRWRAVGELIRQTVQTLKATREFPGLLRFLVARVFYTDAINTVIAVMGLFCINVALGTGLEKNAGEQAVYAVMLAAIIFAVPGGFVWGWLTDRFGPKRTLVWVLYLWILTFLLAIAIAWLGLPLQVLYVVGVLAGLGLGGVWSADRSLLLRMAPPARVGEFFGLYGMVGRFSALTGPAIWALSSYVMMEVFGSEPLVAQGVGIMVLLGFVLVGFVLIRGLPEENNEESKNS